jgi:hypothetical protein
MTAERLAGPLWRLASRVLSAVPPGDAREAVCALRDFTGGPSPARYLAATRLLRHVERRHKLSALGRRANQRRADRGLEMLARGTALAPELVDALRALPPDPRNGRRLTLIVDLLAAYRSIEVLTSAGMFELRRSLGPLPRPASGDRRRKPRGR